MTTFRSNGPWKRAVGLICILGLMGGLVALAIEFHFVEPGYGSPSPDRTKELITHGYHVWVSESVWWVHRIGQVAFFAALAVGVAYTLVRRTRKS
jgi:hypothetical protein